MDIDEVMEQVRKELRASPDSNFSELYFRILECGASISDAHIALYEMLKRDEVITTSGKWRLARPSERRRAS